MKKLFKSYIALAVLALGFSACTEEVEYTPAEAPTNAQVYFSNTNGAQIDIAQDAKSFDIAVSRAAAGTAASIDVYVTADSLANTVFDFPATVEFADSAVSAVYTVNIKEGVELEYSVFHNITLSFDETLTTPYGNGSYSFAVGVPAPWSEWEETSGTFNFSLYVSGAYEIPVLYREHMIDATKAQFLLGFTAIGAKEDVVVDVNKETGACEVGVHYFLDNSNYGPVYLADMPHYPLQQGISYDNYPCTFDAEKGLLSLNLIYFISEALGSSASGYFANGVETLQLDGYYVPDYSLNMEYRGNYVDNNGTNNAVISTTKGVDVAKYLMTVISADEDEKAAIQGMLKGEVPCDTLTEGGFYAYPIAESGNYKVLAITFDAEENPLEAHSTDFEFYMAGQENPWVSLGMATYTEDCVTTFFKVENLSYQVEVRENKDKPGLYRVINPYGAAYPYNEEGDYDTSKEYFFEIDATDPDGVYIPGLYGTGMNWGKGEFSITSMAYYYMVAEGATFEEVKEGGYCGILADNVITFPAGGLLISMAEYNDGGLYKSNNNGAFKLDMSNMTPVEAAPAKASAARINGERELNNVEGGLKLGIRAKKIDNSFLTLKDAVIE